MHNGNQDVPMQSKYAKDVHHRSNMPRMYNRDLNAEDVHQTGFLGPLKIKIVLNGALATPTAGQDWVLLPLGEECNTLYSP